MNIYDIAEKSGYSIATVSRVLNGGQNVSEQTREKVLAVMEAENYTPNAFARGLGLRTMRMVGVLCTDVSDVYYAKAVSLVEAALREQGFDALLCCTGPLLEDKKKAMELLLQKHVDALLLIGSALQEEQDNSHIEAAARQVPVVIINGLVELPNVYSVACDEYAALRHNLDLLAGAECTAPLYLYDSLSFSGSRKLAGFRDGCAANGLTGMERKIEKDLEAAQNELSGLLEQGTTVDAVLCSEDLLAVGAQKALTAAGFNLPIVGFNNSLPAQCATPALTSVDNMLDTLCPAAVGLLMKLLDGKNVPAATMVSARLVERETFRTSR